MKLIPHSRKMFNIIDNRNKIIGFLSKIDISKYDNTKKKYFSKSKDIEYFISEINKVNEYNKLLYSEFLSHYNNKISHMYFYNDTKKVEVFL
jgi:hypothetical protein